MGRCTRLPQTPKPPCPKWAVANQALEARWLDSLAEQLPFAKVAEAEQNCNTGVDDQGSIRVPLRGSLKGSIGV